LDEEPELERITVDDATRECPASLGISRSSLASHELSLMIPLKALIVIARIIDVCSNEVISFLTVSQDRERRVHSGEAERRWLDRLRQLAIYTTKNAIKSEGGDGHYGSPLKASFHVFYTRGFIISASSSSSVDAWRFFALQLFQCRDERPQGPVHPTRRLFRSIRAGFTTRSNRWEIDEELVRGMHEPRSKVGGPVFIIRAGSRLRFSAGLTWH